MMVGFYEFQMAQELMQLDDSQLRQKPPAPSTAAAPTVPAPPAAPEVAKPAKPRSLPKPAAKPNSI